MNNILTLGLLIGACICMLSAIIQDFVFGRDKLEINNLLLWAVIGLIIASHLEFINHLSK